MQPYWLSSKRLFCFCFEILCPYFTNNHASNKKLFDKKSSKRSCYNILLWLIWNALWFIWIDFNFWRNSSVDFLRSLKYFSSIDSYIVFHIFMYFSIMLRGIKTCLLSLSNTSWTVNNIAKTAPDLSLFPSLVLASSACSSGLLILLNYFLFMNSWASISFIL